VEGRSISHYEVSQKLGAGGMGVVYQALDTKLDRLVALKFLPSHLLGDEEVRKRFGREAKAAAALNHPNICPVYEIDQVDGQSFTKAIRKYRPTEATSRIARMSRAQKKHTFGGSRQARVAGKFQKMEAVSRAGVTTAKSCSMSRRPRLPITLR
jgi:serine/threonine protein kinase